MGARTARVRIGASALAAGGLLALGGCGDVGQDDITDFLDKAGKAREQFDENYGDEVDKIFEELQKAADSEAAAQEARDWGTRPEPPPNTPTSEETVLTETGAVERATYPKEAYEDLVAHYADEMGIDIEGQGGPGENGTTLDDDEGTYVVVDNTGGDQVEVTIVYPKP